MRTANQNELFFREDGIQVAFLVPHKQSTVGVGLKKLDAPFLLVLTQEGHDSFRFSVNK